MIAKDSAQDVTTEDRLRGAVWGQFVGDAAALGTHWIYDLSELSAKFPGGVFGFEAPAAGHYHQSKKPGDQTHYGDGALVLLESIAEHGGFDPRAFGDRFVKIFGSSHYPDYLDWATKGTLKNYQRFRESNSPEDYDFQQGADDAEPATGVKTGRAGRPLSPRPQLAGNHRVSNPRLPEQPACNWLHEVSRAVPGGAFSWTRPTRRLRKRDGESRPAVAASQR